MQDGEDTFFAREALQGRLPKYVELLKFKVSVIWLMDNVPLETTGWTPEVSVISTLVVSTQ